MFVDSDTEFAMLCDAPVSQLLFCVLSEQTGRGPEG